MASCYRDRLGNEFSADERLTLTAYGRIFAREVAPVLESLAQSRSRATRHTP
jgi:hypothetical protein